MMSATVTSEAVADGAVCKLSRYCLLYTFVIIEYPEVEWTHKDH